MILAPDSQEMPDSLVHQLGHKKSNARDPEIAELKSLVPSQAKTQPRKMRKTSSADSNGAFTNLQPADDTVNIPDTPMPDDRDERGSLDFSDIHNTIPEHGPLGYSDTHPDLMPGDRTLEIPDTQPYNAYLMPSDETGESPDIVESLLYDGEESYVFFHTSVSVYFGFLDVCFAKCPFVCCVVLCAGFVCGRSIVPSVQAVLARGACPGSTDVKKCALGRKKRRIYIYIYTYIIYV